MTSFHQTQSIIDEALSDKLFTAISVGVVHNEQDAFTLAKGQTLGQSANQVSLSTKFDLASLTKSMATATYMAHLVDQKKMNLDDEVFKEKNNHAYDLKLIKLLSHQSGLRPLIKLNEHLKNLNDDEVIQLILSLEKLNQPKTSYSDLGFILLYVHLKKKFSFDQNIHPFFHKMGLNHLQFNPPVQERSKIPATFIHPMRGLIQGEVFDDNAYFFNGLCGHAGLFGSVIDCMKFTKLWLHALNGKSPIISKETAQRFVSRQMASDGTCFALGFDVPGEKDSTAAQISKNGFGHLGYTGTSMWIDPDRKASVCVLTNRTYPDDQNKDRFRQFRIEIHRSIWQMIDS